MKFGGSERSRNILCNYHALPMSDIDFSYNGGCS
jgi:hypothetical protein